jgi:hypothetical protein
LLARKTRAAVNPGMPDLQNLTTGYLFVRTP